MVELFVTQSVEQLARLRAAVKARDASAVRNLAHALRGSSGNLGAPTMAELCLQLEQAASDPERPCAAELVYDIEAEFARVRTALSAEVSGNALPGND